MIKLEDIEQRSDQDRRAAEPEHPCDPLIAQRRGQRIVGGGFVLQTRPQMFRYAGKPHLLHLTRRSAQVRNWVPGASRIGTAHPYRASRMPSNVSRNGNLGRDFLWCQRIENTLESYSLKSRIHLRGLWSPL